MSCLNLRLPPATKAWKRFTSKIQSKLHKLHKPKAIQKPRNRLKLKTAATSASTSTSRRYRFLELRFQRKRCLVAQSSKHLRLLHERRHTYPAPVYVDKLFKEHAVSEHDTDHKPKTKKSISNKPADPHHHDDQAAAAQAVAVTGTSKGAGRVSAADDDMWESLGLASPQMHGIDQRAEEFIKRFRAQMEVQEMLARDL
ncbi:hypothetical protein FNV43_RR23244 [Rhamnella rubrinervis]|uniref:Uncharacterized protein n=1 Tax=Rhamnella rubrinervis TaxID=2594499 RepID=A0A8K0GNZ0_9ROSA|nr:hypothetical protein FNV43_RR23244 [Rhamnella rubrinervis]